MKKQIEEINSGMRNIKQSSEEMISRSDDKNEIKLGLIVREFNAFILILLIPFFLHFQNNQIDDLYTAFKDEMNLYNPESKPTLFILSVSYPQIIKSSV